MKRSAILNLLSVLQILSGAALLFTCCYSFAPTWTVWFPFTIVSLAFAVSFALRFDEDVGMKKYAD